MKVSFSWLYTKANIIHKETDKTTKRLSPSVMLLFSENIKLNLKEYKEPSKKKKNMPQN